LDGEIVTFGDDGRPSFERLQRRMHVTGGAAVARLAAETPVVYAIFDLLELDGEQLMARPYERRPARLEQLDLNGPARRVPARPGLARARRAHGARRRRKTDAGDARGRPRGHRRQAVGLPLRAGSPERQLAEAQAHAPAGAGDRRLVARRGPPARADRRAAD